MSRFFVTLALAGILALPAEMQADGLQNSLPNIIFVLADDLGYGDLGCYGQQLIQTPNLDRMAREGMRFTNFYAGNTVCAPSRCVLMTGKHMGRCHVRGNAGGDMSRQSLRDEDLTVADVLKSAGYKTALCGKWGLGENTKSDPDNAGLPNKQGFDLFFGYQSQTHAHNYYPAYLWRNTERVNLRNDVVPVGAPSQERLFIAGYSTKRVDYSHDLIMNEALQFVRDNQRNPIFLYLSVTIPHANNEGTRGTGNGQEIPDYGVYHDREGWSDQDKGQAAMITHLDTGVGNLISLLKELGIDDNTVVMFTSDNGHHDEGGHNTDLFDPNGPLRGKKRDLYEGGIRVPMIVRWPGKVAAGSVTDHVSYFGDFMATACDISQTATPEERNSISFLPTLLGESADQQEHDLLYWEFYEQGGKQAVRKGDWKAVRIPIFTGDIELYDLATDLGEATNVAADHPEVIRQMEDAFATAHVRHENWQPRGKAPKTIAKPGDGQPRF